MPFPFPFEIKLHDFIVLIHFSNSTDCASPGKNCSASTAPAAGEKIPFERNQ